MRRSASPLPRYPYVPPTIEERPDAIRVWSQPAANHQDNRPTWEVVIPRPAPAEALRDLLVRLAWEHRVPLDVALPLEAEVRRRLGVG